jgi:hypothetical protein
MLLAFGKYFYHNLSWSKPLMLLALDCGTTTFQKLTTSKVLTSLDCGITTYKKLSTSKVLTGLDCGTTTYQMLTTS